LIVLSTHLQLGTGISFFQKKKFSTGLCLRFRHGYFHPCVVLDVAYRQDTSSTETDTTSDTMVPVYRGNVVKPVEAGREPEVSWTSQSADDLWCLVMTGLDTHLTQVNQLMTSGAWS
jgi:hypothetical protein